MSRAAGEYVVSAEFGDSGVPALHPVPPLHGSRDTPTSLRSGGHHPGLADPATRRSLPVAPALAPLLPGGELRGGMTVSIAGSTALALALLAGPSAAGGWCAVMGVPTLGARAVAEAGVALDRLALVPSPGSQWATVAAALLDGMDVVVIRPPGRVSGGEARRLMARARERGTVLVSLGAWEGAEIRLSAVGGRWAGMGGGTGRLRARRLEVRAEGRGAAARPRRAEVWLPAREGGIAPVSTDADRPAVPIGTAELQVTAV